MTNVCRPRKQSKGLKKRVILLYTNLTVFMVFGDIEKVMLVLWYQTALPAEIF